jgi:hypothetical protein
LLAAETKDGNAARVLERLKNFLGFEGFYQSITYSACHPLPWLTMAQSWHTAFLDLIGKYCAKRHDVCIPPAGGMLVPLIPV